MKTGLILLEDNKFYARWRDKGGQVYSQRKRLSAKIKNDLTPRELETIYIMSKYGKIQAIKRLKDVDGFTLREAIHYVRGLVP